jgi:hypothetical protein
MLLILTMALLPLGLIALFASIQSAHSKTLQREADARIVAMAEARQIDILLLRGANILRSALDNEPFDPERCAARLDMGRQDFHADVSLALLDARGRVKCASRGFTPRRIPAPRSGVGADVLLLAQPAGIRFTLAGSDGGYGAGFLPIDLIARILPTENNGQGIVITQGKTHLQLSTPARKDPLGQRLTVTAPIAGGQASLALTVEANQISAVEI